MPITNDDLKRMSKDLSRLPRRRKSYSRKGAMKVLADKILFLLHEGRSLESIFWRLERKFRISEEAVLEALLDRLKEERPNEDPERVLAEIIDEGRPAVETTATPRIIEQPTPVAGSLPEPEEAGLASPEPEGGIQDFPDRAAMEPEEAGLASPETEGGIQSSPDRVANEPPAGTGSQDKATSARQAGIPAPAFGDGSGLAKLQNYE
ncbi:MAG: hypothetical protein K6E40_12825 [Desulfovibrio sp.]|nr:hypothetical protein [Desulfovibrio sp.]